MSTKDPLDRPVTLRELDDQIRALRAAQKIPTLRKIVSGLVEQASITDFISARFGNSSRDYVYRVVNQPTRRVQPGDLVTCYNPAAGGNPVVARVHMINLAVPKTSRAVAVAISPEDAERITTGLGFGF